MTRPGRAGVGKGAWGLLEIGAFDVERSICGSKGHLTLLKFSARTGTGGKEKCSGDREAACPWPERQHLRKTAAGDKWVLALTGDACQGASSATRTKCSRQSTDETLTVCSNLAKSLSIPVPGGPGTSVTLSKTGLKQNKRCFPGCPRHHSQGGDGILPSL